MSWDYKEFRGETTYDSDFAHPGTSASRPSATKDTRPSTRYEVVVESPPPGGAAAVETFKVLFGGIVMTGGSLVMGLRPMASAGTGSTPDQAGLDHLSFSVASRGDLGQAAAVGGARSRAKISPWSCHSAPALSRAVAWRLRWSLSASTAMTDSFRTRLLLGVLVSPEARTLR